MLYYYDSKKINVNMVDINRRNELNEAIELMHFAFRKLTEKPDELLGKRDMHRLHHRLLYFIARNEGLSVGDLQMILSISKQAMHRPLKKLVEKGLVESMPCSHDARVRKLSLTRTGNALETRLSRMQRNQFRKAFKNVSDEDEYAWRRVMQQLQGVRPAVAQPEEC